MGPQVSMAASLWGDVTAVMTPVASIASPVIISHYVDLTVSVDITS